MSIFSKNSLVYSLVFIVSSSFNFLPGNWIVFEKKDAGFRVAFPRKPAENVRRVDAENGSFQMHAAICNQDGYKDDNALYGVFYFNYPDTSISSYDNNAVIDVFFDNTIRNTVDIHDKLLSVKKLWYKGYPGREVKVSLSVGLMYMRMYLVNKKFYMLQVACEDKNDNNPLIGKFFSSFELTETKKNNLPNKKR